MDKETNYAIIINIVTLIIHRKMWIYTGRGRKNKVMHFFIHNYLLSVDKLCRQFTRIAYIFVCTGGISMEEKKELRRWLKNRHLQMMALGSAI